MHASFINMSGVYVCSIDIDFQGRWIIVLLAGQIIYYRLLIWINLYVCEYLIIIYTFYANFAINPKVFLQNLLICVFGAFVSLQIQAA